MRTTGFKASFSHRLAYHTPPVNVNASDRIPMHRAERALQLRHKNVQKG
jgi:hypothetical protein